MPLKANKLAGVRLVNYWKSGINFKDHANILLDFWIKFKSRDYGFVPVSLKNFYYVEDLPNSAKEAYEEWFNSYDFQNTDDKDYLKFVDGTLNFFYHTESPKEMPEETWFVCLFKSEEKAREIAETQIWHGSPNLNAWTRLETNTKSDEIAGRRNGYIFSTELEFVKPQDTRGFFWAVCFQSRESVKLYYKDGQSEASKIISWAAHQEHSTLLQITSDGRFIVKPVAVEGKGGKIDKNVPAALTPTRTYVGYALGQYLTKNFFEMYGYNDSIDEEIKYIKENTNQRKNAVNTMNDESVKIGKVIPDIEKFIEIGNTTKEDRERNKSLRKNIKEKNKFREKEIKKKVREARKELEKQARTDRQRLNPFISKQ